MMYKYMYYTLHFFQNEKKEKLFFLSQKKLDCVRFVLTVFLKLFSHNSLLRFEMVEMLRQ